MTDSHSPKRGLFQRLLSLDFPPFRRADSAVAGRLEEARRFAGFVQRPRPSRDGVDVDSFRDSPTNSRYQKQIPISEGRTAIVYSAYDSRLKRTVAIKRFRNDPEINAKDDYLAERNSAAAVRHANVVSTYDADKDEQGAFITMEFLKGRNAQLEVREGGAFEVERFVRFARHTLEALAAVHRGGLLHLDLKPTNIMVSQQAGGSEFTKLVDFGRARPIRDESGKPPTGRGLEGSIYFTSPEQLLGEELDETSDIYCLGCVFYWVLAGRRPFTARNAFELKEAHLQSWVLDLKQVARDLPEGLSDWVMNIMSANKLNRPQSAEALLKTLEESSWCVSEQEVLLAEVEQAAGH